MKKTNKELAVKLACSALGAMATIRSSADIAPTPLTGNDIQNILNDCYSAVCSLPSENNEI